MLNILFLLLLACFLFNFMNLNIHLMGHNIVNMLQWQFIGLCFNLEIEASDAGLKANNFLCLFPPLPFPICL